jgi:hypothetical protein
LSIIYSMELSHRAFIRHRKLYFTFLRREYLYKVFGLPYRANVFIYWWIDWFINCLVDLGIFILCCRL